MAHDRRILIADDDREVRLGAAELLEPLGLDVLQAERGDEALELARRLAREDSARTGSAQGAHGAGGAAGAQASPLDLALLDLNMPGHGGLELFGLLRAEFPALPCILWSGDASEALARSALRAGVAAFLHKPVQPVELRLEVRRILHLTA